jgi:hypothetical protein
LRAAVRFDRNMVLEQGKHVLDSHDEFFFYQNCGIYKSSFLLVDIPYHHSSCGVCSFITTYLGI